MVNSRVLLSLVLLAVLSSSFVDSTSVKNCKGRKNGNMLNVEISSCDTAPCILKKNTTTSVAIKFIPKKDVKQLKQHVFARLLGLPVPFVGVDGKLSCDKVFSSDGTTKADCPLRADTEYVYKNSFDILSVYPTVNPMVHWALQDAGNNEDVVCFEIQSKIVQ